MKKAILFLFLFIPIAIFATNYYVAPTGNDSNPGTISQPFFTLNKAWTVISAGDIVYLRGGTFLLPTSQELTGKNGTAANPIKIWAYPGEIPVLTKVKSGWTYRNREGIHFEGNYFHWKGIEITGFGQIDGNIYPGMRIVNSNHNIFELINHHHNGSGFQLTDGCDDNLVLNCDSHNNYDPLTTGDPYGNADGFAINPSHGSTNRFTGCRSWSNSDDGYDLYNCDGLVIFDKCWAWGNGYREDGTTNGGNGDGFKLGVTAKDYSTTHLRTLTNCLAFKNRQNGFSDAEARCIIYLYNNVAYFNANDPNGWKVNFAFTSNDIAHVAKNNIAYKNQFPNNYDALFPGRSVQENNTWNGALTVSDADFISLDANQSKGSRQADGSLPDMTFLHLVAGSKLIDAGVDVGLPYAGKSADVGAFEIQNGSTAPVPVPVFVSAVIENATPSLLAMTYDLSLNNLMVPATSSFNVMVNSVARAVNSLAISGSKVLLTIASAVKSGDVVTVSYSKPTSNPLQIVTGGQAVSISAQLIVNNLVPPVINPVTASIKMTIYPNPVHQIINILFEYTGTSSIQDASKSRQIIRIFDLSGMLCIEKLVDNGASNIQIPINLKQGIYVVLMISNGLQMSAQKIIVY